MAATAPTNIVTPLPHTDFSPKSASALQDDSPPEMTSKVKKLLKAFAAFREGTLTYAQWKLIPKQYQHVYKRVHGVPLTPEEIRGRNAAKAVRRRRSKIARASRRINRRIA